MFASELIGLTVSVIGNLSISWMFLSPEVIPRGSLSSTDFGMMIFVLEFLNVHSTAVAWGVHTSKAQITTSIDFIRRNPKLFLIAFYLSGASIAGFALKSWVIPAYFGIGLISKFYGGRSSRDQLGIVYLIFLLLFSFVLGMRLWVGVAFFMFIWAMGLVFVAYPSFPLWRNLVTKRMEALRASNPKMADPNRQLFRDKLDFLRYSMPLIIFTPFYTASWMANSPLSGELFWALIYFPSLAANDIAVFVRSKFYPAGHDGDNIIV